MLTPEQLSAYLDGSLDANELAQVEAILASDADARRQVLEQRSMHQALRVALGGAEAETRLKRSVLAVTRGQTLLKLKARVLHDTSEPEKVLPLPQSGRPKHQPRNGWSFGWAARLAAAACLAFAAAWWFFLFPPRVAELADVTHEIQVKRGWFTLKGREASALRRGDVVTVKDNSAAAVRYEDGTLLPLAAGAVVELRQPDGTNAGKRIQLRDGLLAARVTKQPPGEELIIGTSQSQVRVVGTEFSLSVNSGLTRLVMEEGAVKFSAIGTELEEVKAGQAAEVRLAKRISVNVKPVERDPREWPFAVDSPWNRPLGDGAKYVAVKTPAPFFPVSAAKRIVRVTQSSTADPKRRILVLNRPFGSAPMPDEFVAQPAPDEINVLAAPTNFLWEVFGARRGSGDLLANAAASGSLTGAGMGAEWATVPGHFASVLGGVIRKGEATTGIRHALNFIFDMKAVNVALPGGKNSVWPAGQLNGVTISLHAASGNVHFGTLLALPPDVDFRALGLGNSGPGYEIARALRDFGAYVASAGPKPFRVLASADAGLPPDEELDRIFNKLLPLLRVVANNTAATPGGGGLPGRAPAPPLAKDF